ncbi:MAG: HNH endonuclease, partial [Nitriliruptorales bacterium]|nr:HNH endonuclease [Nitriliruptorales bacterium]
DAGVVRVITTGASQPLDVGRETRVVSAAQRRALAVRDGGCVGCHAPAVWCEAHHVRHWLDGGPTDLDNLLLACAGCHRDIHDRGWEPVRGPDSHWSLHPPDPAHPPHPPDPPEPAGSPPGQSRPWGSRPSDPPATPARPEAGQARSRASPV